MAKLTLNDLAGGYGSVDLLNANSAAIEMALENTLSRNGTAPNAMGADLDMNDNQIINLGAPIALSDAARWADVLDGVELTGTPVPSQSGQADKVLGTNGTSLAWVSRVPTADLASTSDVALGDALVGVKRIESGAAATTQHQVNQASELNLLVFDPTVDTTGVSDVSAKLQAFIDACKNSAKHGYIPPGVYDVSTMLVMDVGCHLRGAGMYQTFLRRHSGTTIASVLHVGATTGTTQITGVRLSDITIDGNSGCSDAGLKIRNVGFSYFDRIRVINATGMGIRSDTTTTSINTNQNFNTYGYLESGANGGKGMLFQGEKDGRFGTLVSFTNGGDGVEFKAFKDDTSVRCETTECIVGDITSQGNTGNGVVFDQAEKYTVQSILSRFNTQYGCRFRATQTSAGSGSNSVRVANFLSRGDQQGGIGALAADNAVIVGAGFANCYIFDSQAFPNTFGIRLQGAADVEFGSVHIRAVGGDGIRIEAGTPLGTPTESARISFGIAQVVFNGNVSSTTNHGVSILDGSVVVTFNTLILSNSQTSGSNYELNVGASAGPVLAGILYATAISGGNEVNVNSTGILDIGVGHIRGMRSSPLRDGVTAPANNITGFAQRYIDAADGDYKIRYSDGTVKVIVADT